MIIKADSQHACIFYFRISKVFHIVISIATVSKSKLNFAFCLVILHLYVCLQEAWYSGPLFVSGHGSRCALFQFYVLWSEEEMVCTGCCPPAGYQHVRVICGRAGALQRLAEGMALRTKPTGHFSLWETQLIFPPSHRCGCTPGPLPSLGGFWSWPAVLGRCTDRNPAPGLYNPLGRFSWASTWFAW